MTGGLALNRRRLPRKRVRLLRAFPATCRAGVIASARGAWVKQAGTDEEKRFDTTARLSRNIGDQLIVLFGEIGVAAVEVTMVDGGWNERWTVKHVGGDPVVDGDVMVMPARRAG